MIRLSANLGFLWSDLPLTEAVGRAAAAGFDAVELHWPHDVPEEGLARALRAAGLPCLSLNTLRGDVAAGEMGLSALPGREAEAREAIDRTFAYGAAIGARNVHVMAGIAEGPAAKRAFLASLDHAADEAAARGMGVLIEPMNPRDAPGYFLRSETQAVELLGILGRAEIRLMFDCYHMQVAGGDLTRRFAEVVQSVGHVQFAGVPDRDEPDRGELAYERLLPALAALGYEGHFGAEYRPRAGTEEGLGWMAALGA
jgi:hydroxypyruvate isomerase